MKVFDSIPIRLNPEDVSKRLHLQKGEQDMKRTVQELLEVAYTVAKPKTIYEVSYVDDKNEDSLYIGGIKFTSRVLRVNLDKVERVFPYIVTCGKELDEIAVPSDALLERYFLDEIKEMILLSAHSYLKDYLIKNYALGKLSNMNPGSLEDWPIMQQKELFSLFGNVEELIGVKITESCLMIPQKSLSGIFFPSEITFESCQLCPREVCSGRRVPYDPNLIKKYVSSKKKMRQPKELDKSDTI
jgi:hypothetical protein